MKEIICPVTYYPIVNRRIIANPIHEITVVFLDDSNVDVCACKLGDEIRRLEQRAHKQYSRANSYIQKLRAKSQLNVVADLGCSVPIDCGDGSIIHISAAFTTIYRLQWGSFTPFYWHSSVIQVRDAIQGEGFKENYKEQVARVESDLLKVMKRHRQHKDDHRVIVKTSLSAACSAGYGVAA